MFKGSTANIPLALFVSQQGLKTDTPNTLSVNGVWKIKK